MLLIWLLVTCSLPQTTTGIVMALLSTYPWLMAIKKMVYFDGVEVSTSMYDRDGAPLLKSWIAEMKVPSEFVKKMSSKTTKEVTGQSVYFGVSTENHDLKSVY